VEWIVKIDKLRRERKKMSARMSEKENELRKTCKSSSSSLAN